jgi:hypothetical protein
MSGSLSETPIRNVERFRKVRERVLSDGWEQRYWALRRPACGTVHCVAGWTCHDAGDRFAWYESTDWVKPSHAPVEAAIFVVDGGVEVEIFDRAMELLGLTVKEAEELFHSENDLEKVLGLIDQYIQEGELQCSQRS